MQSTLAKAEKHSDSEAANTESKSLTINLYNTGTNGSAKAFAEEMVSSADI